MKKIQIIFKILNSITLLRSIAQSVSILNILHIPEKCVAVLGCMERQIGNNLKIRISKCFEYGVKIRTKSETFRLTSIHAEGQFQQAVLKRPHGKWLHPRYTSSGWHQTHHKMDTQATSFPRYWHNPYTATAFRGAT